LCRADAVLNFVEASFSLNTKPQALNHRKNMTFYKIFTPTGRAKTLQMAATQSKDEVNRARRSQQYYFKERIS